MAVVLVIKQVLVGEKRISQITAGILIKGSHVGLHQNAGSRNDADTVI